MIRYYQSMRGQRLLIRPATPDDAGIVASFFFAEHCVAPANSEALIGKIVGDVAACLSFTVDGDALRIAAIVVSAPLRRKRIGRALVTEALSLARKMRCSSVVVESDQSTAGFFRHIGFELHGNLLVRSVSGGESEA